MAHKPQDESKQPPPAPSTKTNTTLTTTSTAYLSTHLIVPYFINAQREIKRPEHLIAWWSRIFSFYVPDDKDRIELRFLCRLFRDSLKPPPLYTIFPHPNYSTLNMLMDKLSDVFVENPNKAPQIVFVTEGTFHSKDEARRVYITYPMKMIGAGQNKSILSNYRLIIQGMKEEGKTVELTNIDLQGSGWDANGLYCDDGLSFLCDSMTITQCYNHGVEVYNTTGRLINCVITHCQGSGIYSHAGALVEVEGSQTKVEQNITGGDKDRYGLTTYDTSSTIHLLSPLTKESISINNHNDQNYGSRDSICRGTIRTVMTFTGEHNINVK